MARGDHVFVRRFHGLYTHHGIDCGDGSVIHYSGDWAWESRVRETSLEEFAYGERFEVRDYGEFEDLLRAREDPTADASARFHQVLDRLKGLPAADGDRSPDGVVARARSRLGEARFDFAVNNCEHFATWCKTGLSGSIQIEAIWRAILPPPQFLRYRTASRMVSAFHAFGWDR